MIERIVIRLKTGNFGEHISSPKIVKKIIKDFNTNDIVIPVKYRDDFVGAIEKQSMKFDNDNIICVIRVDKTSKELETKQFFSFLKKDMNVKSELICTYSKTKQGEIKSISLEELNLDMDNDDF